MIGNWDSTSRTPERYDSSVCANELLLRDAIVQKMATERKLPDAYHLRAAVTAHVRIGKEPGETPLPNPTVGMATAGEGVIGDTLLTVNDGAQDTAIKETRNIVQNVELIRTQNTDDSEN